MKKEISSNSMDRRLMISAFGIHMGGGLVLLKALLLAARGRTKYALMDARVEKNLHFDAETNVSAVQKSIWSRVKSQSKLAMRGKAGDIFLSFNSLPPLIRSRAYVINYVHAPHFVGAHNGISYTPFTNLRLKIERLWFRLGVHHCDEIWVQTESMYFAMRHQYPQLQVRVVPLVDDLLSRSVKVKNKNENLNDANHCSFFYPADAVGHKNHPRLLAAWSLLAQRGMHPKLLLTLTPAEMARTWAATGLNSADFPQVENLGRLTRADVLEQMQASTALLFPSLAETFGIPMLEARMLDKPILASELDFVRDVCAPVQTFDPKSPHSIARAVERFITGDDVPNLQLYSASQFVEQLMVASRAL